MEVGGLQISTPNPGYGTQGFQLKSFQFVPTGLSPSMAGRFRPLWLYWLGGSWTHNTTSPSSFQEGFGLDCSHFAHATKGIPFGFFSFPYYDISVQGVPVPVWNATDSRRSPLREVSLGYPWIYACMQLPKAFRRLPRPSSALKPSHPPDGVACRAYSVTLQCLFSIG